MIGIEPEDALSAYNLGIWAIATSVAVVSKQTAFGGPDLTIVASITATVTFAIATGLQLYARSRRQGGDPGNSSTDS